MIGGDVAEETKSSGSGIRFKLRRRDFLKVGLAMSGLLVVEMMRRFLSYQEAPAVATRAVLNEPVFYTPGSVTPIPQVRGWLVKDKDGFYAVSSICSHLGCLVKHNDLQGFFECPCHGSQFRLDGSVITGPAVKPLRHVEVSLSPNNQLIINTQVEVPPNQRLVG